MKCGPSSRRSRRSPVEYKSPSGRRASPRRTRLSPREAHLLAGAHGERKAIGGARGEHVRSPKGGIEPATPQAGKNGQEGFDFRAEGTTGWFLLLSITSSALFFFLAAAAFASRSDAPPKRPSKPGVWEKRWLRFSGRSPVVLPRLFNKAET